MGLPTSNCLSLIDLSAAGLSNGAAPTTLTASTGTNATVVAGTIVAKGFNVPQFETITVANGDAHGFSIPITFTKNNYTCYAVLQASIYQKRIVCISPDAAGLTCPMLEFKNGVLCVYDFAGGNSDKPSSLMLPHYAGPVVVAIRVSPTKVTVALNNQFVDVAGVTIGTGTSGGPCFVGNLYNGYGDYSLGGEVGLFAAYSVAHDDATLAANLAYLTSTWQTIPTDEIICTGNSLMTYFGSTVQGQDIPAVMSSQLGPSAWVFGLAIAGQTFEQMISNDPAKLDAILADANAGVIPRKYSVWLEGVNSIKAGDTAAQTLALAQQYYANVVTPRHLNSIPVSQPDWPESEATQLAFTALFRANPKSLGVAMADIGGNYALGPASASLNATYRSQSDFHWTPAGAAFAGTIVTDAVTRLKNFGISKARRHIGA